MNQIVGQARKRAFGASIFLVLLFSAAGAAATTPLTKVERSQIVEDLRQLADAAGRLEYGYVMCKAHPVSYTKDRFAADYGDVLTKQELANDLKAWEASAGKATSAECGDAFNEDTKTVFFLLLEVSRIREGHGK